MSQQETGDENNNKVGSYSYVDAAGVTRTVKYTADASGFHAVIETNEPGTKTSSPADAQYVSSALDAAPAQLAAVKPAQVVVHSSPVVHAVQAAPVALHAAPVSFATAHHVAPVTLSAQPFAISGAPLTYTLTKAKSA
ncbi:hypothetical protein HPB48_007357 [Haemaphysalis longicornis]|uniref:Cuticle protein n=1 Tax=Haemaphysalis longicornis TaxID=44386 RepID=A0A9J6G460_HAELO|nr:hypothetical protein HPB48_007357 [Haemaphysalis longicornis]